ncbi:hypothetical protein Bbelb_282810 [Branchiostoma belcheri]|nr:hypothetical protein Bbelb_282810 [Branchiostoma belcheri]
MSDLATYCGKCGKKLSGGNDEEPADPLGDMFSGATGFGMSPGREAGAGFYGASGSFDSTTGKSLKTLNARKATEKLGHLFNYKPKHSMAKPAAKPKFTVKERKVPLTTGGSRIVVKVGGCSSTQHRERKGTPTWQTVALNHTDVCTEAHSVIWYGVGETLVALYRQRQPPDYSGFEEEDPLRSHEEHCRFAVKARNRAERERIEKKYGARYSSLHDLPYFDVVRMHVIDPMHNLLEGTAKRVMQTFETPAQSRVRRDRALAETDKEALATVTRKRVAIFEPKNVTSIMRRCRVEAKLPALVFRMPGGHQVVLTTAENRTCSAKLGFAVLHGDTAHGKQLEMLWTSRASERTPADTKSTGGSYGVLAAGTSHTDRGRQRRLDYGDEEGAEEHPPLRRGIAGDRPFSATGPVRTPRRRLAPTGQASTSTAPTASDNTGTTDPTPTGYKDGETESLDDSTPGFSLLTDVRLSLSPSPTVTEPTNPPSTSTPTPSSPSALLPVPKKRRLAASPRKPAPG